ncbi:filamentous hemagglutinin N-terminal domain-containing protein [Herbaspirillum sp. HC18]|nr:filamentous hemagglutinin N-terminal domain-containing protein [Herbaspirillum sp. HC18]
MSKNIETAARGREKLRRRLLPVLIAGCFGTAVANPLGPQVINGQAGFSTQGNVLSVTNTPGAIINWQSFSINPGELTRFIQQNPGSAVLNRIVGQDPSQILGALQSNGRVFLINPNGIVFGQGAQVDVNGLVASTLNIGNDDFIKGKWNFQAGDKAGDLKNQGAITTPAGGQVYLIAPNVENSGIITSPKGEVLLAAGHTVQLVDSLDPNLQVVLSAPEHQALNLGKVIAQGGKVGIFGALIKQRGIISADSAVVGENGKIVFKASRDTLLEAGSVTSARGAGKGGEVIVQGERVGLMGDARIDASGNTGGGTVLVGGDYQGRNTQIRNAAVSHVSDGATIKADAIENGDGGKVVVWADDTTRVYGQISARGGSLSGNGGFVETSGHRYLEVDKAPDVSAPKGQGGNWLLDPEDIAISSAASSNVKAAGLPNTFQPDATGSGSTVNAGAIKTAIDAGSTVTIDTSIAGGTGSGNIVIDSSATDLGSLNAGSGAKLILNADNDIAINTSIINTGNPLTMNFKANAYGGATTGNVSLGANVQLKPKGGAVTISSKGDISLAVGAVIGGDMAYDYGTFSLTSTAGGISLNGSAITTNGTVTLKAGGSSGIVTTGTGAGSGGLFVQGSNVALDSAGPITIDKLDGTVVARSTGAGSAISLTDAGALVIGGSSVSSVPAGITTANGDISLNATVGMLDVNGDVNAGTGTVQLSMNENANYGVVADAGITGGSVYVTSGTLGVSGSGTITAGNLYLQPTGGTGPIGASGASLKTASPGGTGNTNISIGYSGSGPSEVYIDHTGNATLTQVTLKAATATPFNMMASGSITTSAGITTNGGNLRLVAHDDLTIGSDANLSTAGGNIDLASNYGNVKIEGSVSSGGAGIPGYIDVAADGDVIIKGSVSASGSPDGGSVYISSYNGNVAFSGASAAVSAMGTGAEVLIDAPSGAITTDDSSHVVIATPDLIFDAGNGIHGPTSADYLMTNVSKLDVSNYGGSVRLKNASGAGLTLTNLHTETQSYAVHHTSTGDVQISDSTSLTVSDSIDAGAGTLILESPVITVAKDVNAHGIQFFTDSLATSTGIVTASGAPTPTSFGGINFSPLTSDKSIKIGSTTLGGELLVDVAKLKTMSDTPVPGDIVSDAFSFHTTATMQISVDSALNLPTATLYMKSGTININAPVTAGTATYIANSFTAGATTTVDTTYGGINIGPYDLARDILIAPSAAGSDPTAGSKLWIDSAALADKFVGNSLAFGTHNSSGGGTDAANSGNITISAPITGTAGTFKNLEFLSKGTVTQSTVSDIISLPGGAIGFAGGATSGGVFLLDVADNSVDHISGFGNTIKFKNAGPLAAYGIKSTGGPISLTAAGGFHSYYGISSKGGNITIKTTGAAHDIIIEPPGIDACDSTTSCTSTVSLDATGSIQIPLVKAGSAVDLKAGGDVIDGDGSANNIVSGSGSPLTLTYTVGGNISLDAWGAFASGTVGGTKDIRLAMPTAGNGGGGSSGGGTTTPTLDQCMTNPTQAGCSAVLPKLDSCITNPTQTGCSAVLPKLDTCVSDPTQTGCGVVLPKLDSCVSNPTQVGCSVVLPKLDSCVSNPTQTGCSAVLPKFDSCMSNPAQAGCSVVLPKLDTCVSNPTQTGCSVVLPKLDSCVSNPTQAGCSVVLPKLDSCVSNPAQTGCSAVLPKLDSCVSNPTQTGCSAVLPKFDSCVSNPTQAGCSVVLPTMNVCTSAPTTAGCSAVLPTLSQCSANPNQEGCSAVLPIASKCTVNPKADGCETVLPSTGQNTGAKETVTETVTTTVNTVVTASAQASVSRVESGGGSSSGGAASSSNQTEKSDEKKDGKKTTTGTEDSGAKKNEKPTTKMYCN